MALGVLLRNVHVHVQSAECKWDDTTIVLVQLKYILSGINRLPKIYIKQIFKSIKQNQPSQ